MLSVITEAIGKLIKFDLTTVKLERGNYARICIEIDQSLLVKKQD